MLAVSRPWNILPCGLSSRFQGQASPQNPCILFQMHIWNIMKISKPSHTELSHSIRPPSPFSFLHFPSGLHLSFVTSLKKQKLTTVGIKLVLYNLTVVGMVVVAYLEVSWNRGTPSHHPYLDGIVPNKNHPFMGTPISGTPYLWKPKGELKTQRSSWSSCVAPVAPLGSDRCRRSSRSLVWGLPSNGRWKTAAAEIVWCIWW